MKDNCMSIKHTFANFMLLIKYPLICFSVSTKKEMKEITLDVILFDFILDSRITDTADILHIQEYLMKKT